MLTNSERMKVRRANESTDEDLESEASSNGEMATDHCYFVWFIMYLQGVGALFPWNAFITPFDYFQLRFENSSFQSSFESIFTTTFTVIGLITIIVLQWAQEYLSLRVRIAGSLTMLFFIFALVTILAIAPLVQGGDDFSSGANVQVGASRPATSHPRLRRPQADAPASAPLVTTMQLHGVPFPSFPHGHVPHIAAPPFRRRLASHPALFLPSHSLWCSSAAWAVTHTITHTFAHTVTHTLTHNVTHTVTHTITQFVVLECCVGLSGMAVAVLTGSIMSYSSIFGSGAYIQAVIGGQGIAGLTVALGNMLRTLPSVTKDCAGTSAGKLEHDREVVAGAAVYFGASCLILLLCLVSFIKCERMQFTRACFKKAEIRNRRVTALEHGRAWVAVGSQHGQGHAPKPCHQGQHQRLPSARPSTAATDAHASSWPRLPPPQGLTSTRHSCLRPRRPTSTPSASRP